MSDESRCSSMEITLSDMRDNMEHAAANPSDEWYLPGMCGEPKMCPRVGDQYQVTVPDLIEENVCPQQKAGKSDEAVRFLVLPIPLMWAPNKARDEERLKALDGHADPHAEAHQIILKNELMEKAANKQVESSDIKLQVDMIKFDVTSCTGAARQQSKQEHNLYPLPGTPDEPWSDFEHDSFLLALYVFGKDLYLVKKFVETKKMEDVISFYYGPFYKCKEYQRWAKCLRSRSRKSIHGQRIFTRGRQQELFSRLNSHISEEISKNLVEATKAWTEEVISFEEYVFTLKNLVGTKLLIEVVAIGKGKQDLTGISTDTRKLNRSISVPRETQQDKGLSSLSCIEITEQLTSSRLSKNKSNELFWEAIWPRLLAGGWHSEQPKDYGVSTFKHQLVFLMPGIKKFRRNKHVKGQHYFDSVSDVLNKVASDPRILELENEKEKDIEHEENHLDVQNTDLPNGKHNGYLKLCNSNQQQYEMEFMIVDTSKHRGSKVRWMESLPVHPADISTSSSACSGTGSDSSSEKSDGEGEETCANVSAQTANGIRSLKKQVAGSIDIKKRSSKKHRLGGTVKSGPPKYLSPLKRHQEKADGHEFLTKITDKKKDRHLILCLPNPRKVKENKLSLKGLDAQLSPPNSSHIASESSHMVATNLLHKMNADNRYTVCESSKRTERHPEQSIAHAAIDLNIPQVPEDGESNLDMIHHSTYSSSLTENTSLARNHKDTSGNNNTLLPRETTQQTQQVNDASVDQKQHPKIIQEQEQPETQQEQQLPKTQEELQPNMLGRRHSTRNRPLTTKALEAFESSFFDTNKKRKATDSSTSRPSRRRCKNSKSNSISDSGIGSNDMTGTRTEEISATGNSGTATVWMHPLPPRPPPQASLQL